MPVPNTNHYIDRGGGVVAIVTVKGDEFLIDAADAEKTRRHCWSKQTNGYARAVTRLSTGKLHTIYLHRFVCETSPDMPHVDHKDGDIRNCRRQNLRACNRAQNLQNQKIRADSRTGFKGVGLHKQTGKYRARVRSMSVCRNLGLFETVEAAYAATVAARQEMHGEFARHG